MTDKKSRDIEVRRKELEEELDSYAQVGVSSPGVVKAARWVSRIMYLLMGAVVVIVLWTNKDAVPLKDFEAQKKIVVKVKKQYKDLQAENSTLNENLTSAMSSAVSVKVQAASYINGEIAANRAEIAAKALIASVEFQRSQAEAWRKRIRPEFDDQAAQLAEQAIADASVLPLAARNAAIEKLPEFGNPALTTAANNAFIKPGQESIALTILTYLGDTEIGFAYLRASIFDKLKRQMALKISMQTKLVPANGGRTDLSFFAPDTYFTAEAWVGYALSAETVDLQPLIDAFKTAPDENRFELLALLAEVAPANQSAFFRQVATQGSDGERLIAIRWMGNRRADDPKNIAVLEGLISEYDPIAEDAKVLAVIEGLKINIDDLIEDTAKVALKRIQDAKKNE